MNANNFLASLLVMVLIAIIVHTIVVVKADREKQVKPQVIHDESYQPILNPQPEPDVPLFEESQFDLDYRHFVGRVESIGDVWTGNGDGSIVVRSKGRSITVNISGYPPKENETHIRLRSCDYVQDLVGKMVVVLVDYKGYTEFIGELP